MKRFVDNIADSRPAQSYFCFLLVTQLPRLGTACYAILLILRIHTRSTSHAKSDVIKSPWHRLKHQNYWRNYSVHSFQVSFCPDGAIRGYSSERQALESTCGTPMLSVRLLRRFLFIENSLLIGSFRGSIQDLLNTFSVFV